MALWNNRKPIKYTNMELQIGYKFKLDVGRPDPATVSIADISHDIIVEFLDSDIGWPYSACEDRLALYTPVGNKDRYWYLDRSDVQKSIEKYGLIESSEIYQIY